jgi:arylsulfatase
VVRWPAKILPGTIVRAPISSADFLPTVLDLAGVSIPKQLEGVSMLPALMGQRPMRRYLFAEVHRGVSLGGGFWQLILTDRWKFVQFTGRSGSHLYEIKNDPHEAVDLIDDPNYHGVMVRMRGKLKEWQSRTPTAVVRPKQIHSEEAEQRD